MTIKPHEEWGVDVTRPVDLRLVASDADLAAAIAADRDAPVGVTAGDLFRTIGARPLDHRSTLRALPLDLMHVTIDGTEPLVAVSHVVVRSPRRRGGWWRGPVTLIMNAEFLGDWDVATRGHPNDGRVERFDLDAATGWRQRRAIADRLPSGSHLPHPSVTRRPGREHVVECARPMSVWVDGVSRGAAQTVVVSVEADAATVLT